jgi:hypothetical protein
MTRGEQRRYVNVSERIVGEEGEGGDEREKERGGERGGTVAEAFYFL